MSFSSEFRGIGGKLFLLTVVTLGCQLVASGVTFYYSHKAAGESDKVIELYDPARLLKAELETSFHESVRGAWSITQLRDEGSKARFDGGRKHMREVRARFAAMPLDPHIVEAWKPVDATLAALEERYMAFQDAAMKTEVGDPATLEAMGRDILPLARGVDDSFKTLREALEKRAEEEIAVAAADSKLAERINLFAPLVGVVVSLTMSFLYSRGMRRRLKDLSHGLGSAGQEVSNASHLLSGSSAELSNGAIENAASLEETVSSLEELSSMVQMNADNAKQADALAQAARERAETGSQQLQGLMAAMNEIAAQSLKIEEIISVIDSIAFQTNLLALNAAVEAARAGEQGKGFAVVADAVRNLAQRSADAAKDITGLIKESVGRSDAGVRQAQRSGEVLSQIVGEVKKVSDLVSEIAGASNEQAAGVSQISMAMNQLDAVTQRNAASAEETASASHELEAQAGRMRDLVQELNAFVEGARAGSAAGTASGMGTAPVAQEATGPHAEASMRRDVQSQAKVTRPPTTGARPAPTGSPATRKGTSPAAGSPALRRAPHAPGLAPVAHSAPPARASSHAAHVIPFDSDVPGESETGEPRLGNVAGF